MENALWMEANIRIGAVNWKTSFFTQFIYFFLVVFVRAPLKPHNKQNVERNLTHNWIFILPIIFLLPFRVKTFFFPSFNGFEKWTNFHAYMHLL